MFKLRVAASPMSSRLWGWLALVACESRLLAAGLRPICHGQSAAHRRISGESESESSTAATGSGTVTAAGPRGRPRPRAGPGVAGDAGGPAARAGVIRVGFWRAGALSQAPPEVMPGPRAWYHCRRPQSDAARGHARSPGPVPGPHH